MRDWFEIIFGAGSGFGLFQLFSNPSHKIFIDKTSPKLTKKLRSVKRNVYKKIPNLKVNRFEFFPSISIYHKNHRIHLHHWIPLSVILGVLIYESSNITHLTILKSFTAGGVIHGFLYRDRFKIFKKNNRPQTLNSKEATTGK